MKLYIMRGISGSGKSTMAKSLPGVSAENIFSTDDFFVADGQYRFDQSKLGRAHDWNQKRVEAAMQSGATPIVVDNTNTQLWEARPYVVMANYHGYEIEILEPETEWKFDAAELVKRNEHGVPRVAIQRMLDRYVPMAQFTIAAIMQEKSKSNRVSDKRNKPERIPRKVWAEREDAFVQIEG